MAIFDSFDLATDEGFEALMARFDATYLSAGAQRTVYAVGKLPFVVKVQQNVGGDRRLADGNRKEAEAYRKAVEAGLADSMATVYAVSDSGKYLLMEKVNAAASEKLRQPGSPWAPSDLGRNLRKKFTAMFEPLGIEGDFHTRNIGKRGNKWVVLDMGIAL